VLEADRDGLISVEFRRTLAPGRRRIARRGRRQVVGNHPTHVVLVGQIHIAQIGEAGEFAIDVLELPGQATVLETLERFYAAAREILQLVEKRSRS
jgi:phage protein U